MPIHDERPFDIRELKQYFFEDCQPVEEFDLEEARLRFERLFGEG
jgi:hypothetical protein